MKEISIKDIKGFLIGNAQDAKGGTGCTVIISEQGMKAGLDVRGGGPASRESEILKPLAHAEQIHAVLLGGGSAFGLDASGGVMKFLEEKNIGFDVGVTKVPLVCQSDIFDLRVGDPFIRPDIQMGYEVCKNAYMNNYQDGNYGAGTGATVGKVLGMDGCMKSGIGSFAVQIGQLQVGAVVVVNSVGDVYDYKTGKILAGMLNEDGKTFKDSKKVMYEQMDTDEEPFAGNTTIGAILTNAKLSKSQLCKVAGMAHNGYARSIAPVHTSMDGDSIYALSIGEVEANLDMIGTLAADVMSEAIIRAVKTASSAYGHPAYKDIQ